MTPKKARIGRPPREDEAVKLSVYVPDELMMQLKVHCVYTRQTMSAVVQDLLERYMAKQG